MTLVPLEVANINQNNIGRCIYKSECKSCILDFRLQSY